MPGAGGVGNQLGAHLGRGLGGAGLVADDDDPLDHPRRRDRLEDVGEHRRDQGQALLLLDAGGEPLLRLGEPLDREYRCRLQPSLKLAARSSTMRARRALAAALSISVGAAWVRISSGGGSGSPSSTTIASISPA